MIKATNFLASIKQTKEVILVYLDNFFRLKVFLLLEMTKHLVSLFNKSISPKKRQKQSENYYILI